MVFLLMVIGGVLRFYNLMWGDGMFFHPDENNMAGSIAQMTPDKNLNPNFFAYGQFPLYLAYFSAQLQLFFSSLLPTFNPTEGAIYAFKLPDTTSILKPVPYSMAIFWLRFWSATFSTLTIGLVYNVIKLLIVKKEHHSNIKNIVQHFTYNFANPLIFPFTGALFVTFMPGLIQSAHFGTTEALLTFLFMAILYCSLQIYRGHRKVFYALLTGVLIGLGLGTKLTAALFMVPPFLAILFFTLSARGNWISRMRAFVLLHIMIVVMACLFFFLTSPYSLLDFEHFRGTSRYEAEVALGKVPVFYTRQFIETIPFIHQTTTSLPYALGIGVYLLGFASLILIPFLISRMKDKLLNMKYIVVLASFIVFLATNSILFVKWTRFFTPVFPFFPLFIGLLLYIISHQAPQTARRLLTLAIVIFAGFTVVQGLAFFSIYTRHDVRYTASEWIYENIPNGTYILSETGNVVDIPFQVNDTEGKDKYPDPHNYTVISFDFYHLDEDEKLPGELVEHLEKADYIFVPSRRIYANHLRLPEQFPKVSDYHTNLFNGNLGFTEVAHISSFPTFMGIQFPDEQAEETWTVFDHPVVRIYKKTTTHPRDYYEQLLTPQ
jgi:hypothetical protein